MREYQSFIDGMFEGVSESDKRKMICENAARVYGFN